MPCAIAVAANSPVFTLSPRPGLSPIFCKPSMSISPSGRSQLSPSPSPSPLSPFTTLRFQKQPISFVNYSSNRYGSNGHNKNEPAMCSVSSPSTALLKRKRPARIDVPIAPICLESDFENQNPGDASRLNEVENEGEGYAVYCKRGKRRGAMEDRHSAVAGIQGDSMKAIFSVFDGHGGAKTAEFAAKNLNENIINQLDRRNEGGMEEAIKEGYLTTDAECMKENIVGGACCVTALIQEGNLVVSNAGDCRAVMSRGGVAEALTFDHRPSRQDERERIQALGGYVDCCNGIWRIQGSLAVSRGIGDRHLKQWVIAKPDTKILKIEPECEFLILASDGLWDKVNNQEAVDIVRPLCVGVENSDRSAACKKLVKLSLDRGSTDDVSVMVIQLSHFLP